MAIKRVTFSVLIPQEGSIDVTASTDEEAIAVVQSLMQDNYVNFKVAQVLDLPNNQDAEENTNHTPKVLN